MLIKCKECNLPISDKALFCPHCGLPMTDEPLRIRPSSKRRRLPNGFGQITTLKNRNLRKPYRAMVTIGKTPEGRPICKLLKPISYFATYNEAYAALIEYNKNPYDFSNNITMAELYEKWSEQYYKTLKVTTHYEAGWNYCDAIKNIKVTDIRTRHLKHCIETAVNQHGKIATPTMQRIMKTIFGLMLDYAVEYEIVDHNYAKDFVLSKEIKKLEKENLKSHVSLTDEEMKYVWSQIDTPIGRMVLIQSYMGWRPQEMLDIELKNINLNERYIIGGIKTDAGINRIVPIATKIKEIVELAYQDAEQNGRLKLFAMPYQTYYKKYKLLLPGHRPHDSRKQFVTMAKRMNVDEYAIKRAVGHAINDITEKIYTDRSIEWLRSEVDKISNIDFENV